MDKQQLLLVERDAKTRRLLKVSLEQAGYAVTTVRDGADALARLELSTPSLVLAATNLPKLDGYALVRRMKDHTEWARIPVIFLISGESIEDKIRGLELGVDEYLQKPVFVKELLSRVQVLLARRVRLHLSESAAQTRVAGSLADLTPIDLLESLADGGQTGVLRITGARSGDVFFEQGEITDARHRQLRGEEALFRMLGWASGDFEVVPGEVSDERTIEEGTRAVIDAGMRHASEYNRLVSQLPPIGTVMLVDPDELASHSDQIPEALHGFLELFDGERTIEDIIDESPFDDLSTLETIAKLDAEGMLSVVERDEEHGAVEPPPEEPEMEAPPAAVPAVAEAEPVAPVEPEPSVPEVPLEPEPSVPAAPIEPEPVEPLPSAPAALPDPEPSAPSAPTAGEVAPQGEEPAEDEDDDDEIYSQVTARPPVSREALVVDADTSGSGAFEVPRPPSDAPAEAPPEVPPDAPAEGIDTRSWSTDMDEGAEYAPDVDASERPTVALAEVPSSPGLAGSELELAEAPSSPGLRTARDSMDALVDKSTSARVPAAGESLEELDWDDDDDLAVTRERKPAAPDEVATDPAPEEGADVAPAAAPTTPDEPEELDPADLIPDESDAEPSRPGAPATPPAGGPGTAAEAAADAEPEGVEPDGDDGSEGDETQPSSQPSPPTPAPDTAAGHRPPPTPQSEAVTRRVPEEEDSEEGPPSDTDSKPELSETVRSRRGDDEAPSSKRGRPSKKKKKKGKKGDGPPSSKRPSSRAPSSRRPLSESGFSAQWYDAAPEGEEEEEEFPESIQEPEYLTDEQVARKERGKRIVAAVVGLLVALAVYVFVFRRDTAPPETRTGPQPSAVDTGSVTTPTPTGPTSLPQIGMPSEPPVATGGAGGAKAEGGAQASGGAGGAQASGGAGGAKASGVGGSEDLPEVEDPLKETAKKMNIGDYKGAIPMAKAAIKKNPGHADAYYFLGLAYESLGQFDKKLDTYDACVANATEGQYLQYCKQGARKK